MITITGWAAGRTPFRHEDGGSQALCGPVMIEFPEELVLAKGEQVSCPACIAARLVRDGCPECESKRLVWGYTPRNTAGVVDGRLRLHDVRVEFYLGCEECSETLAVVDAEYVARFLSALARQEDAR
jgi:hypothetical protein